MGGVPVLSKTPLITKNISTLSSQLRDFNLGGDGGKNRIINDVKSGRAYALMATGYLDRAMAAQCNEEAMEWLLQAQAAYIIALRLQVKDHTKLMRRPDRGGRPDQGHLAHRLWQLAHDRPEKTVIAKCLAAFEEDEILRETYAGKAKKTINAAFLAGKPANNL